MKVEIDQSGKVEKTAKTTYVSDSLSHTIQISSRNKLVLQNIYRKAGRPRMFVYELFSALVAILIRQSYTKTNIYIVDTEYLHQDQKLRQLILRYLQKVKIYADKNQIRFAKIGKKSKAHSTAYLSYKKNSPSVKVFKEVLRILVQ